MPLSDDQIELLQAYIDDLPGGIYDAMDVIPADHRKYFSPPREHGKKFKKAVEQGKLTGIHIGKMDMGSKHWRYVVHGG